MKTTVNNKEKITYFCNIVSRIEVFPKTFLKEMRKKVKGFTDMQYSGHSTVLAVWDADVDKLEMTSGLTQHISLLERQTVSNIIIGHNLSWD